MDRRAFALGAVAFAATPPGSACAQEPSLRRRRFQLQDERPPARYEPPPPPRLPEEFLFLQDPALELDLDEKLNLLPRVPGTLIDVRGRELSRSGWTFFDDQGVFAALFGDGLDDETLVGLVRVSDSRRPSLSVYTRAAAPFALPTGYVAHEALTRYAYISGATPADGAGGDYAVALTGADTEASLMERLRVAQQSWANYIEHYGASAVNRL